jgi:hypothetical protein
MTEPRFVPSGRQLPSGSQLPYFEFCSDDPRLRGFSWTWAARHFIDVSVVVGEPDDEGYHRSVEVDRLGVGDDADGRPAIGATPDAFAAHLSWRYSDPTEINALRAKATFEKRAPGRRMTGST